MDHSFKNLWNVLKMNNDETVFSESKEIFNDKNGCDIIKIKVLLLSIPSRMLLNSLIGSKLQSTLKHSIS